MAKKEISQVEGEVTTSTSEVAAGVAQVMNAKSGREPTPVESVTMEDGRVLAFAGKKRMLKEVLLDTEAGSVAVRFDFRNGATRTFSVSNENILQLAGHGAAQKIGDEAAGLEELDDIVIAIDEMIARLDKGEWTATRASGDGFSGASVVIRAICEATGKDVAFVKNYLQSKLDTAKAKGESLTRAELYASFRNPTSKTGVIIARLEADKKAKTQKVNADDLLGEIA
jgi:hypothetical protein